MAKSISAGETHEAVAYALLMNVAHSENKVNSYSETVFISADKAWILNTYVECLLAAQGVKPSQ